MGWGREGGKEGRRVWAGYLKSNYECFLISGCKDIDF